MKLLKNLEKKFLCNNYHPLNVMIHRAKGPYLYDIHGKRYIDLISGYSAANFGHLNKEIVKTVKR